MFLAGTSLAFFSRVVPFRAALLASTLLIASDLPSQQKQQKTPEASCSVRGMVVRAEGGEPIKGARVSLAQRSELAGNYQTSTDAEGNFAFTNVVAGTYSLAVLKNGFVAQRYGQKRSRDAGVPVALLAGQKLHDIVFRMVAAAGVIGKVVDEEGNPKQGVEISAVPAQPVPGLMARVMASEQRRVYRWPAGRVITDDLGEFRIYGLAPGKYFLKATDRGFPPGLSEHQVQEGGFTWVGGDQSGNTYPTVYYPGTARFDQASAVELKADQEARIDFRLLPQVATFTVSGHVVMAKGQSTHVAVWLDELDSDNPWSRPRFHTRTNKSGEFEMKHVTPGTYFARARAQDGSSDHRARQKIEVHDSDLNVMLVMSAPRKVVGRIIMQGGIKLDPRTLQIYLEPLDQDQEGGSGADINKDGTFTISQLQENTYRVHVSDHRENSYVQSARYGSEDVLAGDLVLSRETPVAALEIVVSGAAARLQGRVLDARRKPAPGAHVYLVPLQKRWLESRLKGDRADQNGTFSMRGIAPGQYKLIASVDDETEMASVELAFGESESRTVELKAQEQETASSKR